MIGTILNAIAIIAGGIIGLTAKNLITPAWQGVIKIGMGVFIIYVGLSTTWGAINGTFGQVSKQLGIMLLAMMLGNATGKLLHIQKGLNKLGKYARERYAEATPDKKPNFSEGFITCTLLFCVGPMAIIGSLQDGLTGDYRTLATKAIMDGLATMVFITTMGWGVLLSVLPVVAYQGTITLLAKNLSPYLQDRILMDSVNATGGMLIFCIALIILEIKKVQLADYLPSLAYAPLLTWWLGK